MQKPYRNLVLTSLAVFFIVSCKKEPATTTGVIQVTMEDSFWSPRFAQWRTTTVNDIFDKFEGKYDSKASTSLAADFEKMGTSRNAFQNFDLVAEGKRGIGIHNGPPWYDGLVYESIRGTADFLARYPDSTLERRLDGYIDKIAAAQASDPDGYINTYTQLMEPDHRWGFNGGVLRWQHDVYNSGMLVEAAVHYYKATGKTKLLDVTVKLANFMCADIGPAPKKNVVPAHSGPEEAFMKLYWLFKNEPDLKEKIDSPVKEKQYYELVKFWIENRGHHVGLPLWNTWGNEAAEQWIREVTYDDPKYGEHRRPTWGAYAQDSIPVFEQKNIEGHAVRATLLATGIATAALENNDNRYIDAADRLWNNMVGNRMFISGGVGAIAHDEKFGEDYFLPNDAYLETCAAVGVGFFSQRMNELKGDGKYVDELERVLYNGILTGISAEGTHYTYQNPLEAGQHQRWEWHDCPCCPPMFLKIVAAIPDFIYNYNTKGLYINLFVGNKAKFRHNNQDISLSMTTKYPWNGKVAMRLSAATDVKLPVMIRIPGWATGQENPFGLYLSNAGTQVTLKVNGESITVVAANGYVTIDRTWKEGDEIQLELPMQPRFIYAREEVKNLNGQVAIASGPVVYGLEHNGNPALEKLVIDTKESMQITFDPTLLGGVSVITGRGDTGKAGDVEFTAVPYFAIGNATPGDSYKVWVTSKQ
jgi:DUF1680 family protein